jgi:hypothetical protein
MKNYFYLLSILLFSFACSKVENTPLKAALNLRADTRNCSDFVVYKYGSYKGDTITFEIRNFAEKLDTVSNSLKAIDLAKKNNGETVIQITTYKNYPPFSYCPGIIPKDYQPEQDLVWESVSGNLEMKVKEKLPSPPNFPMVKVNFTLKNVILKNSKGDTITIPNLLMENVIVGGPIPG